MHTLIDFSEIDAQDLQKLTLANLYFIPIKPLVKNIKK